MEDLDPSDPAAPFERPGGPVAVLCLHGLTGTPFVWRPLADALAAAGYHVRAPRLVGHGHDPAVLRHTRFLDWLGTARRAFDDLAERHPRIFIVGLSMGSLAGLVLAHERGDRVAGVVAMATPLELKPTQQLMLGLARKLPLADALPYALKRSGPDVSDPGVAAAMPDYDRTPIAAAASMLEGQAAVKARMARLSVPVLVQHGRHDHVAPVRNVQLLMDGLRTPSRRAIIYPRSWHILPLDVEHTAVIRDVLDFVEDPVGFTRRGPQPLA
ncbi:MAG: alpha/beta fold hydrolase [Myxococcales bacterium]|nr:alpha/beta fold hydrolase [Myxococcales bacterium]